MNGPSVRFLDAEMPIAESSTQIRLLGTAFKMVASSAFRVAHECDPAVWPFTVDFTGNFDVRGQVFDVAVTVTITPQGEPPHDPTGSAAPLPLGN